MRRLLRAFAAAAIPLLAVSFAHAEGIQNSKHDFSAATWSDKEICKPCHTPHNAVETNLTGRLWAHTLSTAQYAYHGGSLTNPDGTTRPEAGTGTATQADMDVATRLCLSCHDGTVALDSFMGKDGASDGIVIGADADHGAATANLGNGQVANDLTNDHPVGFKAVYDENAGNATQDPAGHYRYKPRAAAVAAGLRFATSTTPVTGTPVDRSDPTKTVTGNLPSISCITCHDVHNGAGHEDGLLRMSNEGSAMCLTCHDK
jgi:predicted CXXCH cytochrome family protein